MKRLKRHVVRLRVRLAGLSVGARFATGLLAVVIFGGAVWLVWAMVSPEPMIAVAGELDAEARGRAAVALDREGIRFRRTQDGLTVSQRNLVDARKVIRSDALGGKSSGSDLWSQANSSSMWRSSAENKRLWQAGVMSELGRLVTEMDPVASARVLFEPGCPGGLGSQARASRAAVKVTLVKGRRMSPRLVVAIGELVSGSVAVDIGDVRVIDQTGRSYRPSSEVQAFAQRHAVEAYYSEKIMSALRYIPSVSVDVQIIGDRTELKQVAEEPLRVWISIPRSYVLSAGGQESENRQLRSIKEFARAILSPTGKHEVTVALRGPDTVADAPVSEAGRGLSQSMFLVAMIASAVLGGMGLWLLLRCRGMVGQASNSISLVVSDESSDGLRSDMPASFSDDGADDLNEDLTREHPQTLALILARMPSDQAADIISRLPDDVRVEVARRMDDLSDVDAEVVSEINRDLAMRLGGRAVSLSGQSGDVENIDHRRAERDALKLQVFEDIMLLGAGELRVALGAVEPDDLAISLRMAAKQVRRKVLGSLSPKDAEYVRARMDRIGPMRICDVESARQRVMETVSQAAGVPHASQDVLRDAVMEEMV